MFAFDARFAADDDGSLPTSLLAPCGNLDQAVYFGYYSFRILLASQSFKDFRNAGQTTRDIADTRGFTRRLGEYRTGRNPCSFEPPRCWHVTNRQIINVQGLSIRRLPQQNDLWDAVRPL